MEPASEDVSATVLGLKSVALLFMPRDAPLPAVIATALSLLTARPDAAVWMVLVLVPMALLLKACVSVIAEPDVSRL